MAQPIYVLPAPPAPLAAQRGGTVIGVVVGLLVGLVLAVVVAVLVMKSPGPFIEKVKRPGEVNTDGGALPDPNKGLSKGKTGEPAAPDATSAAGNAAGTEGAADAKGVSLGAGSAPTAGTPADSAASSSGTPAGSPSAPAPVVVATPLPPVPVLPAGPGSSSAGATGTAPQPQSAAQSSSAGESTPERASTYLLQIAAYRSQEDAESTKGRLALVGLEAGIARAEVNGTTFWRVRVGPFRDLDETNRARTRLAENGFDSSVIRLR